MTKFEIVIVALVGAMCVAFGWNGEGFVSDLALLMGGINLGAVIVFALDERVGGDNE
jgi:hypothetical protein